MKKTLKTERGNKNVSAKNVAEALGISISTVSRAFTPNGNVSPKTRERILACAKELGYRPNPFAQSLITQKSRIVAILVSDFFNPFFPEALFVLTGQLQAYAFNVMLFNVPEGKTPEEVLPDVMQYQPGFIIVVTATVDFQREIALSSAESTIIFFNRYVPGTNTFSVTCDNKQGGREIADFLIRTGHRNMGFVAGTPGATTSIDRGRGFMQRCSSAGLSVIQDNQARVFSYDDGRRAIKRLLEKAPNLDAVFCANDIVALGALDGLRHDMNIKVPEDISLVGFDDVSIAAWPSHNLTTYRYPIRRVAHATVELIKDIEDDPDSQPTAIRIPGELIIRGTHRDRTGTTGQTSVGSLDSGVMDV